MKKVSLIIKSRSATDRGESWSLAKFNLVELNSRGTGRLKAKESLSWKLLDPRF
jgi:hypothetical protein